MGDVAQIEFVEAYCQHHLLAEERREKPSADSNPVREKSLARTTGIMNKRRTRRQTREQKKKGLTQEYILFTPLDELYSNGLSEDGTGKIHHLNARSQSNAMQAERDCHMVWNTLSNYVAPWSPTAKGYTLATRSKPN